MDKLNGWNTPLDLYCERLDPSFWSEPVNALSNLIIFGAGLLFIRSVLRVSRKRAIAPDLTFLFLGLLISVVGIGSFLFHTFANKWSLLADVLPILIFIGLAFGIYLRRIFNLSPIAAFVYSLTLAMVIYAIDSSPYDRFFNGSLSYFPAWFACFFMACFSYKSHSRVAKKLFQATFVFTLSLCFRSVDMMVCPFFSVGTHFLWHTLNGLTLYLIAMGMLQKRARRQISR